MANILNNYYKLKLKNNVKIKYCCILYKKDKREEFIWDKKEWISNEKK